MKIQINTDHTIDGREAMAQHAETVVGNKLGHLSEHVKAYSRVNRRMNSGRVFRCSVLLRLGDPHQQRDDLERLLSRLSQQILRGPFLEVPPPFWHGGPARQMH